MSDNYIKDGDGLCIEVIATFDETVSSPVDLTPNAMIAHSFFYFEPSNVTFTLTPNPGEACPLSPELKLFSTEFDDLDLLIPIFLAAGGAETAGLDNCAQLSLEMVSGEVIVLINEADPSLPLNATLNWELNP